MGVRSSCAASPTPPIDFQRPPSNAVRPNELSLVVVRPRSSNPVSSRQLVQHEFALQSIDEDAIARAWTAQSPTGWAELRLPDGNSVDRAGDLRRRSTFGMGSANGPAVSASTSAQEGSRSSVPHRESTVVDTTKKHGVWRGSRQCCLDLRP